MLQISSGILRGIPLRSPTGNQTRPSSERLRQSLFNVLRHYRWQSSTNILDGVTAVDLFAGTGAWGFEALSNGAREVWFVESHANALRCLQENVKTTLKCFESQGLQEPVIHILRRDVGQSYRKLPQTRLMFCDPPYELGWFEKVLRFEEQADRIVAGGLFLFEASAQESIPVNTGKLRHFDTKIYGDSVVHFFVKQSL